MINDLIVIVLIGNTHWTLLVAYIQKKEIHYYDSMSGSGKKHLEGIRDWIIDEAKVKKGIELDPNEFKLVSRERHVPQQENGFDCGVFSIICADYLTDDLPLDYGQNDMWYFRKKICASIIKGTLDYLPQQ